MVYMYTLRGVCERACVFLLVFVQMHGVCVQKHANRANLHDKICLQTFVRPLLRILTKMLHR